MELTKQERNSLICAIDSKLISLKVKLKEIPINNPIDTLLEIKQEITNLNNIRSKLF